MDNEKCVLIVIAFLTVNNSHIQNKIVNTQNSFNHFKIDYLLTA